MTGAGEKMEKRVFWLVWSPEGKVAPKVRHTNYREALIAAQRMADSYKGNSFFVVRTISHSQFVGNVETEILTEGLDYTIKEGKDIS